MTEVAFHFNAPDKWAYACRLLRKAVNTGVRVVVCAQAEGLAHLDGLLWTFSPQEFIPHCLADASACELASSPVILTEQLSADVLSLNAQVLVNLGQDIAQGFESFDRVIEVVTLEDGDRQSARQRWKHYTDRGYNIVRHDLNLKPESA